MRRVTYAAALGALTALTMSMPANAQGTALDRFDPAPAGDRFFGVQGPSTQGDLELHVMALADYGHNPFVLTRARGVGDAGSIVEHQVMLHLNAQLALWNHLTLGFDLPVAVYQKGKDQVFDGQTYAGADGADFGEVRLNARGTFYGRQTDPFQIGLGGYIWIPSGPGDEYVGDGYVRGSAELLLGGQMNSVYWNFAMGPQFRASQTLIGAEQGTMFSLSGGLGVLLGDEDQVQLGPEFKVSINTSDPVTKNHNAEVLLGGKYRFLDVMQMGLALGPGVTRGIGTPDFRGVFSLAYSPDTNAKPAPDGDGDGTPDATDACPDKAGPASDDPKTRGCPPPPPAADADADGVADTLDACPNVAGVASEDPQKNGCPSDRDGDGIVDADDMCPDQALPQGALADPQRAGCPAADGDGDGVADHLDACPTASGPATADPKTSGCPGDTDGDGVRDDKDACPQLKGKTDADPAKNGCPKTVRLKAGEIVILQQVQFLTGTSNIKDESGPLLDEVAQVLKDHPEIAELEVQGHTDNKGDKGLNDRLSQRRADAVMRALTARGIDKTRLTAKGYGMDTPIASNDTDEGRAKNRRVAFKILKRASK